MARMGATVAATCAVMAMAVSGCGSSSSSSSSSAPTNTGSASPKPTGRACTIVTEADAQAVLGVAVTKGTASLIGVNESCLYSPVPNPANTTVYGLSVTIFRGPSAAAVVQIATSLGATTAVPGVGDQAFRDPAGRILIAGKQSIAVDLDIIGGFQGSADTTVPRLVTLAQKVLAAG